MNRAQTKLEVCKVMKQLLCRQFEPGKTCLNFYWMDIPQTSDEKNIADHTTYEKSNIVYTWTL